jgi:hypothetical protein
MTWFLIVIAIAVAALVAWALMRRRRSAMLREGFGPEYDRTVERAGDRSTAEADLLDRQQRNDELELRPLGPESRQTFIAEWQSTQAAFVDDPTAAIVDADRLIPRAMRERGYPVEDFNERASIVSVAHPLVVERYRRAHAISVAHAGAGVGTDELRQAMQDYRSLFMEIVEGTVEAPQDVARGTATAADRSG